MGRLEINLLGPVRITLDGQPAVLKTNLARALLAYLAVEARQTHRRTALVGLLWPEQPESRAHHSLRQTLLYLRQGIQDDIRGPFLLIDRGQIQFNQESDHVLDIADFEALLRATRQHPHANLKACLTCMQRLRQAADSYRGDFLAQFFLDTSAPFEEWVLFKREGLRREALWALSVLADYHTAFQDYTAAIQYAWRQVEIDALREEGHRQLMHALALSDRRSEALAQYESLRLLLDEELAVSPSIETSQLFQQIREGSLKGERSKPAGLPRQFTAFVGREKELAEIDACLDDPACALLTILGTGGVGKTRLAVEVARRRSHLYPDAAAYVPLAAIEGVDFLASSIATRLGLSISGVSNPRAQLVEFLGSKGLLLVLDNFEHLSEGASLLVEILRAAPAVKILTTSRQPLNLHAEWRYELDGLTYPPAGASPDGPRGLYSAGRLFLESARRIRPAYDPSVGEMAAIYQACRLLGGLPLGIELAAAQVQRLTAVEIAQSIADDLDALSTRMEDVPERQRSLRAVFNYSWNLLSWQERIVLARLSVFRGGFTTRAAAEVAQASPGDMLSLAEKSFLVVVEAHRYDLHELLRQYSAEKLAADPEQRDQVLERHFRYFLALLMEDESLLRSDRQKTALERIRDEIDNIRAGWWNALKTGDPQSIAPFVDGLWGYYDDLGLYQEGLALFTPVLEGRASSTEAVWAYIQMCVGFFHQRLGQFLAARQNLQASLARYQSIGDRLNCAHCLYYLGGNASDTGDLHTALEQLSQTQSIYEELGETRRLGNTLAKLGSVFELRGRFSEAEEALERSLAIKRSFGIPVALSISMNNLALLCWRVGKYERAESLFLESLAISRKLENQDLIAIDSGNLARLYISLGRYREAGVLLREALAIEEGVGNQRQTAIILNNLGHLAYLQGEDATALHYLQKSMAINRQVQNWRELAFSHLYLGKVHLGRRDLQAAKDFFRQSLLSARRLGLTPLALETLVEVARLQAAEEEPRRALALVRWLQGHPAAWYSTCQTAAGLQGDLETLLGNSLQIAPGLEL
jgi:predicted ATPase/DNA-binding SARP family transcriptional activator